MATGWRLGANQQLVTDRSAGGSRSPRRTFRRRDRQPVGQGGGKRGARGYDAGKKIVGRKRHILVDTLGLLMCVLITACNVQDRDGAQTLLEKAQPNCKRLKTIFADGGYAGQLVDWVRDKCSWLLSIIKRTSTGFEVLPKRWVVERTFAWLTRYRRLARDYEVLPETMEAQTYAAMTHLMVRRYAKQLRQAKAALEDE